MTERLVGAQCGCFWQVTCSMAVQNWKAVNRDQKFHTCRGLVEKKMEISLTRLDIRCCHKPLAFPRNPSQLNEIWAQRSSPFRVCLHLSGNRWRYVISCYSSATDKTLMSVFNQKRRQHFLGKAIHVHVAWLPSKHSVSIHWPPSSFLSVAFSFASRSPMPSFLPSSFTCRMWQGNATNSLAFSKMLSAPYFHYIQTRLFFFSRPLEYFLIFFSSGPSVSLHTTIRTLKRQR